MKEILLTFKRLKWFFKQYIKDYILCFLALLFVSVLPVVPTKVLGIAIDDIVMGNVTPSRIYFYIFGLLIIPIFIYFVNIFYHYTMNKLGQELSFKLREQYLDHLFELDAYVYEKYTKGDLIARISNDLNTVSGLATSFLQNVIYYFVTIVASISVMVVINPILSIASIAFMPIAIFILNNIRKKKRLPFMVWWQLRNLPRNSYHRSFVWQKPGSFITEHWQKNVRRKISMKNKKGLLVIMMMLGILTMSVPVSAATPDEVPKELQVQEKETEQLVKNEDNEKSEPITPDGNLTLVDDFSGKETEAKQFITLVTKDGNYFYLVIDRDDEGKETVHFLNQVDEADLLSLMEDEEIEELGLGQEEQPIEEIIAEEPEEIIIEESKPEEKKNPQVSTGVILSGMIAVVGFLILAAVKLKEIKKNDRKESEKEEEDEEEYYEFMDLEQEMNGEGLDEESI